MRKSFSFSKICLTLIGRAVLPNTPSAPNVVLIKQPRREKDEKLRWNEPVDDKSHPDAHARAGGRLSPVCRTRPSLLTFAASVRACARDVRRRQRSSRADGVCQRDARAWRGEARGRSAHDASRQLGVENFRGKTGGEPEPARPEPEATRRRKMKGLPGSAPLLQLCASTLRL